MVNFHAFGADIPFDRAACLAGLLNVLYLTRFLFRAKRGGTDQLIGMNAVPALHCCSLNRDVVL